MTYNMLIYYARKFKRALFKSKNLNFIKINEYICIFAQIDVKF